MSALDRDKAIFLLWEAYDSVPPGLVDRLEKCVRPTPVLVYSEEDFRAKVDAEAKLARIAALCDELDAAVRYQEDALFAATVFATNSVRAVLDGGHRAL